MFHFFRLLLVFTCIAPFAAGAQEPQPASTQYADCTRLVKQDSKAGLKLAQSWLRETGAVAARHCVALALFEMQDYKAAANTLDLILQALSPEQGNLWLSMKKQAATAHQHAGSSSGAIRHLTDAIIRENKTDETNARMAPLLLQRARIYSSQGEYLRAVHDLDHAYSLEPSHSVLLERARIFIAMGKLQSAQEDIEAILQEEPDNQAATALLRAMEQRRRS